MLPSNRTIVTQRTLQSGPIAVLTDFLILIAKPRDYRIAAHSVTSRCKATTDGAKSRMSYFLNNYTNGHTTTNAPDIYSFVTLTMESSI